jgi:hypothetical protein
MRGALLAWESLSRIDVSELVIPTFHDVLGDVMAHGHTRYGCTGTWIREELMSGEIDVSEVPSPVERV